MESLRISTAIEITQQCSCFNLQKATRAITRVYDQALRPSGLRTGQFLLLTQIKISAPITIKPLAAKMIEPISKIVDNAQEQGVSRRKSAAYSLVCEHFKEAHNAAIGC